MAKRLPIPTLGTHGGVVGRPRTVPPADAAKQIVALAAKGLGQRSIAAKLGTNRMTLKEWYESHPELLEAFERGRANLEEKLMGIMLDGAVEGRPANINAIAFGKIVLGWREGVDSSDSAARFNVVINLPGERPLSDFIEAGNAADSVPKTRP